MSPSFMRLFAIALAGIASVQAASSCPTVSSDGEPVGEIKDINGTQIYHSYSAEKTTNSSKAVLYLTDIFGVPLLENKLLADSLARANYLVVMPDLFKGDAIPVDNAEGGLNLTDWLTRHTPAEVDSIIAKTIKYMQSEFGVTKIGAVGYCFGGKYVARNMASGKGINVGFTAHPSNLETQEVEGIAGPISFAAGQLDGAFGATARQSAEEKLTSRNSTFQITLYSGAPHGFAVRPDATVPQQRFAKEASFLQAVTWLDAWL